MQVLALYSIKGGVGKTASAINLAHAAALGGARVLLWDLDPQGATSYYLRVKTATTPESRRLQKKKHLRERIRESDFPGLDVVPADFAYRHLDLALERAKRPEERLSQWLDPLAGEYDFVFLDCPPSISLASESVFAASGVLLVPTVPTPLSLRALAQLIGHLEKRRAAPAVRPFFCLVDRRKKLHREICGDPRAVPGTAMLETTIPYASEVERMGVERQPLALYAPSSLAARAYVALWREIVGSLTRIQ